MRYLDAVYDNPELPHRAKTVYMYLHDRMNRDKQCWPAIRTIARELSLSVSTVKRASGLDIFGQSRGGGRMGGRAV